MLKDGKMDKNDNFIEAFKALESENAEMGRKISKATLFNQAVLKAAPFGLTIFDEKIRIIDCNDAVLKILNTTKQYYIDNFFEFSTEYQPNGQKTKERAFDLMKRAMQGETITLDWSHRTLENEIIPCELTVTCIENENEFTGLAFVYDLRNMKSMEEKILKAARLNKAIIDSMPIGMAIFDSTPRVIDCNPALLKLFDSTKEHIASRFYEDFSPEFLPDGRNALEEAYKITNRAIDGETVKTQWPHQTAKGESVPCELTLTHVQDEDEFIGLGFLYDLREIKNMSANLHEQGELLKTRLKQQELISEITKSFVSTVDTEILINDALKKVGDFLNISRLMIFNIDYEQKHSSLVYKYIAENTSMEALPLNDTFSIISNVFKEHLPDDGVSELLICDDVTNAHHLNLLSTVNIMSVLSAPLYAEGHLWGVLSAEQCYTKRTWLPIEMSFITTMGSVISGAILRKIYNDKLKTALTQATAASEAKGVFLSNMSHEIRTPLNAIIGMTVIGKNADDLPRKDYCFEKIENASHHLLGVINDVLDMSKIEANKFELTNDEFDFEKMLQRVVNIISFRADEKRQKLTVHIDKSIPRMIIGDDQRLAQVITNLLGNGVKFTPEEGSIKLDTRLLSKEDEIYTIRITVKDSGIGISPEQQQLLFRSFHQAEAGTSRKFGGTGLGLAISKNIVELMGGSFELESEIGKGASFSFTFKARRGKKKVKHLSEIGVNWENVSIMIVDDDQEILDYFKDILQSFGTDCDTALSGQEALGLIGKNGIYNIYFVDWKMPEMDGIMLAKELKATSKVPEKTIVIMISAAEWSTIAEEAKKAGVDKFLSKPLFPSAIADVITESIGCNYAPEVTQTENVEIFKGFKVLLAEDVEINREIVEALIQPTQLEIDCAVNGVEAVSMFEKNRNAYDLILMDLQMPEMDGYEATRRIREIEADRKNNKGDTQQPIPIIAMTANVFREDIERCINAGMNDHVGKPLDINEFFIILRKYLIKNDS